MVLSYEVECRNCGWRTVCGREDAAARLRILGLLRREPDPADELVATLLVEAAPRMTCPVCKEKRLSAAPVERATVEGDWQDAALCEVCRAPIPPERLEAIPGTTRCAACQQSAESGRITEAEVEYCPHCGALVEIRASRGAGITRYKRVCTGTPPCRL